MTSTPLSTKEIREALVLINESPESFVRLVIDGSIIGDYAKLQRLCKVLYVLRLTEARKQNDDKTLKQPSPIETEYGLDLKLLQRQLGKQSRERAGKTSSLITQKRAPNTLRWFAFKELLHDQAQRSLASRKAREMIDAALCREFELDTFELLLNAMSEDFLDVADRHQARLLASHMFRNVEPSELGIDVEARRSRYESDCDERIVEEDIDVRYGFGTYFVLTSIGA